ncbi:uncharacterized protein LOC131950775 [Physella acuta]|uniref:uncharacterized protein LOC131950775 n=1 Tax=Physella acuta TaxID=109671 RepID=UPI0027DB40DE|nr:uncharacterized protein LOC131950775 [Physella acuta]
MKDYKEEQVMINGALFYNLTWTVNGLTEEYKASQQLPLFKIEVELPIQESDCTDISSFWVQNPPNVTLSADCPRGPGVKNGYIRRGTTAECGCEVYNNGPITATVKWFTSDGQPVMLRNESVLEVTYNPDEKKQSYECRATSVMGVETRLQFVPKFYYPPNVFDFTVNKSNSTIVSVGANVVFYCEVEGDPPAKALINGSGLGQVKEIQSNTSVLELVLEDLQCDDSGRYFCMGVNGFEDNGTMDHNFVDANVLCPPKVKNNSSEIPVVHVSRDKNTVFTLEIYGYPEPTKFGLKIESGTFSSDVNSNSYHISYITTVPPFGLVTVSLTDSSSKAITTYILTVANTEGKLELRFIAIDQDQISVQTDDSAFWMKVGLGVGLSVLVLAVVIAVSIICFRRHNLNGQGGSEGNLPHPDDYVSDESSTDQSSTTPIDNWLFTNISYLPSPDKELNFNHSYKDFIEPPPDYFDD